MTNIDFLGTPNFFFKSAEPLRSTNTLGANFFVNIVLFRFFLLLLCIYRAAQLGQKHILQLFCQIKMNICHLKMNTNN